VRLRHAPLGQLIHVARPSVACTGGFGGVKHTEPRILNQLFHRAASCRLVFETLDCALCGQPDCAAHSTIERVLYPLGSVSVNL
jgi:hypothetical protein